MTLGLKIHRIIPVKNLFKVLSRFHRRYEFARGALPTELPYHLARAGLELAVMRQTVRDQCQGYKKACDSIACRICGKQTNIHVDHKKTFKRLSEQWQNTENGVEPALVEVPRRGPLYLMSNTTRRQSWRGLPSREHHAAHPLCELQSQEAPQ